MLRSAQCSRLLHRIPYRAGYEDPIKSEDKMLKSDMEDGSFDQYEEFLAKLSN